MHKRAANQLMTSSPKKKHFWCSSARCASIWTHNHGWMRAWRCAHWKDSSHYWKRAHNSKQLQGWLARTDRWLHWSFLASSRKAQRLVWIKSLILAWLDIACQWSWIQSKCNAKWVRWGLESSTSRFTWSCGHSCLWARFTRISWTLRTIELSKAITLAAGTSKSSCHW